MNSNKGSRTSGFFQSRAGWVMLAFLGIAAFFLLTEHRVHLFGILPYLLLLLCPFMHLFMHGGHGMHGGGRGKGSGHDEKQSHSSEGGEI